MAKPVILVVEDNKTHAYALKQLLEQFDYQAQVVETGEEALAILAASNFAAIIMDVTLPKMNGYECTRILRLQEERSGRRTPIIAVTARSEPEDRDACIEAGMDDYLSKPFNPEDLRKILLRSVYQPNYPNLKILKSFSK